MKQLRALSSVSKPLLESPNFLPIGTPPTLLSIQSPPSYPIYLRKNSLISLYFPQNNDSPFSKLITSELHSNLSELLRFKYPVSYQKVISTVPFNATVANHTNSYKTFEILKLDGTSDWAIFNSESIQTYCGNLTIKKKFFPSKVSKKLAKQVTTSQTGLNHYHSFSFITGRGIVGLLGNGEVLKLELLENERILINKKNVLGLKINGINDLSNLIYKQFFLKNNGQSEKFVEKSVNKWFKSVKKIVPEEEEVIPKSYNFVKQETINTYLNSFVNFTSRSLKIVSDFIKNFLINDNYITVIGPTVILLQSNNQMNYKQVYKKDDTKEVKKDIQASTEIPIKTEDRLSFVEIDNGKAKFQNTSTF